MIALWCDVDVITWVLNDILKKKRTVIIDDFIVLYGEPFEWIKVLNLRSNELIFRVEFENIGGIDVDLKKVELHPGVEGFSSFIEWVDLQRGV